MHSPSFSTSFAGDMAIRRGKGFCELSMVPPYFFSRLVSISFCKAAGMLHLAGH
jgi:hypothetical protein